jgi:hypothetical protein
VSDWSIILNVILSKAEKHRGLNTGDAYKKSASCIFHVSPHEQGNLFGNQEIPGLGYPKFQMEILTSMLYNLKAVCHYSCQSDLKRTDGREVITAKHKQCTVRIAEGM